MITLAVVDARVKDCHQSKLQLSTNIALHSDTSIQNLLT